MASPSASRQTSGSSRAPVRRSTSRTRTYRPPEMVLPARFEEEGDDEDVTGTAQDGGGGYIQQSLYGLVGAAQSKMQYAGRFQPDSGSESEGEGETDGSGGKQSKPSSGRPSLEERRPSPKLESSRHRKQKSESKTLKSFLRPVRERSDSQPNDMMSQSQFLPPKEAHAEEPERPASAGGVRNDAPMMDRKLQAKAKADMDGSTTSTTSRRAKEDSIGGSLDKKKGSTDLSVALAEIFQLETPEEVICEYPCWYLQSVLLQGYMYITKKHVCFYAYMQKKGNTVIKSGHLGKQGKRNPRFRRYWFVLKGDILTYYESAANPYFPNGAIDLRYGISAELAPEKGAEKPKETTTFTVTTDKRTYYFKADSITSAKEWVKQLQRIIFRSRNEGDSVKICLPLVNVVDVESNPVIDFAETVRLRVIDNEGTLAVNEYFFTFFSFGAEVLNLLSVLTEGGRARNAALQAGEREAVDRTSPRGSGEYRRLGDKTTRTSFDRDRPGISGDSRSEYFQGAKSSKSAPSQSPNASAESLTTSEHAPNSPLTPDGPQVDMSASQMLTGDAAFGGPTLRMPQARPHVSGPTVRPPPSPLTSDDDRASVKPPRRAQTERVSPSSDRGGMGATGEQKPRPSLTTSSAPQPVRTMLATPLQYAYGLAGHVRNQSKRGLSYLGSSPKDYYTKFSGALAGGKRHYSEADGLAAEDRIDDPEEDLDTAEHERRFQEHFALPASERLLAVFYCSLHRVLPLYGKVYIGTRHFCFRSLLYGTRTKLVVPFYNILNVEKEKGFRWSYPGMVVVIKGHEEIFFDFGSNGLRDDCVVTVLRSLDTVRAIEESLVLTEGERRDAAGAAAENELLQTARKDGYADYNMKPPQFADDEEIDSSPIIFDDPSASVLDFTPQKSMRITCLTIGSRGDVQPYIALCKGLLAEGHKPRIASHHEFKDWVEEHGIEFVPVEGDPKELMRICVENGMFTPSFMWEANSKFRGWLNTLLGSSYEACKGSDLLIESPSAMAGIHIAEALGIPYFRAFTMPWTRTRAYPHAFAVPNRKWGGQYNYMSYVTFDTVFWSMTAGQINRWRRKVLGIQPTNMEKLQQNKVPFLYNFSPNVVVPPLDFSDWVKVTGYWFLDEGNDYTPPDDLMAFIKKAREDKQKLVYIGFGSVVVGDAKQLTQQVVDAVLKAGVRCILAKGWSDHFEKKDPTAPEIPLPPSVHQIKAAPHDWLFRQIDAAVHHGGAGTTGASLRAGVPTIIRPFFGDQYFFATRVEDLGVGVYLRKITVNALGKALWIATHDDRMRKKAKVLGEQIRAEDGVGTAIKAIYRDLDYARSLIKKPRVKIGEEPEEEEAEESWTFVENDSDVDVTGARFGEQAAASSSRRMDYTKPSRLGSMVLRTARLT